jgi:hypothetical protein
VACFDQCGSNGRAQIGKHRPPPPAACTVPPVHSPWTPHCRGGAALAALRVTRVHRIKLTETRRDCALSVGASGRGEVRAPAQRGCRIRPRELKTREQLIGTGIGTQRVDTGQYYEGRIGRGAFGNANKSRHLATRRHYAGCLKQHFKTGALVGPAGDIAAQAFKKRFPPRDGRLSDFTHPRHPSRPRHHSDDER